MPKTLTAGDLKALLASVPDGLEVQVSFHRAGEDELESDTFIGGLAMAEVTEGCDGEPYLALSATDDEDTFADLREGRTEPAPPPTLPAPQRHLKLVE
jgi:hypothetical protein